MTKHRKKMESIINDLILHIMHKRFYSMLVGESGHRGPMNHGGDPLTDTAETIVVKIEEKDASELITHMLMIIPDFAREIVDVIVKGHAIIHIFVNVFGRKPMPAQKNGVAAIPKILKSIINDLGVEPGSIAQNGRGVGKNKDIAIDKAWSVMREKIQVMLLMERQVTGEISDIGRLCAAGKKSIDVVIFNGNEGSDIFLPGMRCGHRNCCAIKAIDDSGADDKKKMKNITQAP